MTGKERMLQTLRFEEPDRPPHFEVMFELEEEAFGLRFPQWADWQGCTRDEKDHLVGRCMAIYEKIVERYAWDALAVFYPWSDPDGVRAAKATFGEELLIGSIVGGTIWSIEGMQDWMQFSLDLVERPEEIHAEAERKTQYALDTFTRLADAGADFIHVVNDVAFNAGPFISPTQFREFITPYLQRQVAHIKALGVIPFVHTDGNIMPILEDYLSLEAACFQSVDPMAGMDIAEVKRRCHGRLALMGNVQCNLLQDGPLEAIRASARYCLEHASPGGGYIFGTSNTIFRGMPLAHYEYMLEVYGEFCAETARGGDGVGDEPQIERI
jgi:uroporphyrinogen decarboxylase